MREIRNDDRESQTYAPRWPPMVGTLDEEPTTTISPNTDPRHAGVSSTRETTARRRKVRKGTRSCWECKRRKIRCIFSSSEDVACIGCQRRRTPCVSQEMPEDLSPARIGNRHLGHRIAKVEGFMKELLAGKDVGATGWVEGEPQQDQSPGYAVPKGRSKDSASSSIRASLTHTEVRNPVIITFYGFPNCHLESWRAHSKFITRTGQSAYTK